jgi:hypothetical protein
MDPVTVKVTRLKLLGYGIRVWLRGKLWWSRIVKQRTEIGPTIASDLRMLDKCGAGSPMADASRHRQHKKR